MSAREACIQARKPKGDLSHLLQPLGLRRSLDKITHFLRSPGGVFAITAAIAVAAINPAAALGLTSAYSTFALSAGLSMIPSMLGTKWEKRRSSGKITNLSSTVVDIRKEAERKGCSFYYATLPLIQYKFLLFQSQQNNTLDVNRIKTLHSKKIRLAALHDPGTVEKSSFFFNVVNVIIQNYEGKLGNPGGLLGTAYSEAASMQFEDTIQSVIKRGLSSLLDCHQPYASARLFQRDLQERGVNRDRPTRAEPDVMYISVSYRYVDGETLSPREWGETVIAITKIAKRLGYDKIRIWADKLTITETMEWTTVGFLPYLIYPTYVHPNARHNTNRLWIELEKFAASLGPGILNEDTTEDDVMQHLVLCRSPAESLLSFAEVLVSGCLNHLQVTVEEDRWRMVRWGKALLTTAKVSQLFSVPRYDMDYCTENRHDASMLCLFDDDLIDNYAVRTYIQHTGQLTRASSRRGGMQWDGMKQILGDERIRHSDDIKKLIEKSAFVLHRTEIIGGETTVWYVVCTLRGKVVAEVRLKGQPGSDIREWTVIDCRRLQKQEVDASEYNSWFHAPISKQNLHCIPHKKLQWFWAA